MDVCHSCSCVITLHQALDRKYKKNLELSGTELAILNRELGNSEWCDLNRAIPKENGTNQSFPENLAILPNWKYPKRAPSNFTRVLLEFTSMSLNPLELHYVS